MIDRRAFLRTLGFGTVAAAAAAHGFFDVERLLWLPGEKTIFIPEPHVAVNTFEVADWITREALKILESHLQLVDSFNCEYSARIWS